MNYCGISEYVSGTTPAAVITVDRKDFRIYRRNRCEMIPLICPPG